MTENLNFPCVDSLIEGVHYHLVEWNFAGQGPAKTPGTPCPEGQKVVFGVCRKVKKGGSDWSPSEESDQEKNLKGRATKEGSSASNNKAISEGGKKYGWAIKGGKPVIVEWGSVSGTGPKPKPKPQGKLGVK
jgi:hypothetical protein